MRDILRFLRRRRAPRLGEADRLLALMKQARETRRAHHAGRISAEEAARRIARLKRGKLPC